jgi:hypothetical protein
MPADRAASILARFTATYATFSAKLRNLPPGVAGDRPDARSWSPAQIGCHVAMTNEWIARVLTGAIPAAERVSGDFVESFDAAALPPTEETFPDLVPPYPVSRDAALERLRASSQYVAKAIAALASEQGTRTCVRLSFGTLSLYELADFAATHMTRHLAQVDRTIAARV